MAPNPAGYSGTPLPKKLGITEGSTVILVGAPPDFEATLGELPAGIRIRRRAAGQGNVVLVFAQRAADIEKRRDRLEPLLADKGHLWLCWPKKASGVPTDLDGAAIRALGLSMGLVDTKVCAVNETWSGHRFNRRR